MLGRATGAVLIGVEARLVRGRGRPRGRTSERFRRSGCRTPRSREGIERIRSAIPHAGFALPDGRAIINLAPAEIQKQGTGLDLPIAVALLAAAGQIHREPSRGHGDRGELGLDGSVEADPRSALDRDGGRARRPAPPAGPARNAAGSGADRGRRGRAGRRPSRTSRRRTDAGRSARGRTSPRGSARRRRAGRRTTLRDVRGQALRATGARGRRGGGHHLLLSGPPGRQEHAGAAAPGDPAAR